MIHVHVGQAVQFLSKLRIHAATVTKVHPDGLVDLVFVTTHGLGDAQWQARYKIPHREEARVNQDWWCLPGTGEEQT